MKIKNKATHFETKAIHDGSAPDPRTGAVTPPIYQTSTYAQKSPGEHTGYEYSRTQNPTRDCFQEAIASLEGGQRGFAFASGMAAITTILHLLEKDSHVICGDDVYGGTFRVFDKVLSQRAFSFSFVDFSNPAQLEKHIQNNTRMIWIETPTNPMLTIIDIPAVCKIAKKHGIMVVVDNTFATPYLQQPLLMGADIVVHSTTKYIGGHSDVVGGAAIVKDAALADQIAFLQNAMGAIPGPFDVWLTHRGLRTLAVRMKQHCENAMKIARFLEKHPKIDRVIYPGLTSHPQYPLASRQMKDFGGMISCHLKANLTKTKKFLSSLQVFTLAESLGGIESLIEHPAIMTHASIPAPARKKLGITDGMIRLSVGIEHVDDLIDDLTQALKKI
jgi:cystathionine beta-lyase/cystathionine gamma-synthase